MAKTTAVAVRAAADEMAKSAKTEIWLPFLNTYGTMRLTPEPDLRRVVLAPAGGSYLKSHLSCDREAFNRASAQAL